MLISTRDLSSASILSAIAMTAWMAQASCAAEVAATVTRASGQPVEDAVVFVYEQKNSTFTPPQEPVTMDQVDIEFVPHLLPVTVGTRVRFPNKDNIHHHVYSFSPSKKFELHLYKGEPAEPVLFDKPGVVKLGCNIHDWMNGIILVLPTPHYARTNARGEALLTLPDMESVELAVFHENLKSAVDATRKTIVLDPQKPARAAWTVELKRSIPKKRPESDYP